MSNSYNHKLSKGLEILWEDENCLNQLKNHANFSTLKAFQKKLICQKNYIEKYGANAEKPGKWVSRVTQADFLCDTINRYMACPCMAGQLMPWDEGFVAPQLDEDEKKEAEKKAVVKPPPLKRKRSASKLRINSPRSRKL